MTNLDLSSAIRARSPLLADLLIGPHVELARAALGKALTGDDQASFDDIAAAVSRSGDTGLQIRQAEEQLLTNLSDAGLTLAQVNAQVASKQLDTLNSLEQLAQRDRDSARQRQIDTHDSTNKWLAYCVTAGFFLVLGALIFSKYWPPPKDSGQAFDAVLQTLLGILGTAWVSIITFYFGSSVGSKEKTALLAEDVHANNRQ